MAATEIFSMQNNFTQRDKGSEVGICTCCDSLDARSYDGVTLQSPRKRVFRQRNRPSLDKGFVYSRARPDRTVRLAGFLALLLDLRTGGLGLLEGMSRGLFDVSPAGSTQYS